MWPMLTLLSRSPYLKGFNSEVEEHFENQKRYSIPDADLCQQLRGDIRDIILGPYKRFLER